MSASPAGKGDNQRPHNKKKFESSPFWKPKPAHVCKKCRCMVGLNEKHFCPADGWYEVAPGHWRMGDTGRIKNSRNFIAKQHGCAVHQADDFNKEYGAYGHWDKKGQPTFNDAHSLTGFRKAYGFPDY